MEAIIVLALIIFSLVVSIVLLVQSRFESLIAWAVAALALVELIIHFPKG